jgi:hypothetical protein
MKKLLSLFVILLSVSCSVTQKPITNVQNVPYGASITKDEAAKIITTAGLNRGWQIKRIAPNMLEGTLYNREHTVVVSIPLTDTGYSIVYKSSQGMNADGTNIHRAYNRWVRNLEEDINIEMSRYSLRK